MNPGISDTATAAASSSPLLYALALAALLAVGLVVFLVLRRRAGRRLSEPAVKPTQKAAPSTTADRQAPATAEAPAEAGKTLKEGLGRTRRDGFVTRLAGLFRKQLDPDVELKIEEILLTADIGVRNAEQLISAVRSRLGEKDHGGPAAVLELLKDEISAILRPMSAAPAPADASQGPTVILFVGVNGVGKTTSIGKLAARFGGSGRRVLVVAGDTFRAAAVEQLQIWAGRAAAGFFSAREGADPASVCFEGVRKGVEEGYDYVLVDTAGRLHTKDNLIEELKKVRRSAGKACAGAPHQTLLVLDATNGQNALAQADTFTRETGVDGIVLTKLDGTAKGGVIIGIAERFGIPVRWVGTGERVQDLRPFSSDEFVEALFSGVDTPDESA